MELEGKVAVVTGGGTGIGKATALLFAREGAGLVLAGRREEPLRQTVAEIARGGGRATYVVTDVGEAAQVQRLFDRAAEFGGRIDILFNNAGIFITGRETQDYADAEWDRILRANFWGTLLCSRSAVPYFKKNGGGVIINCTSVSGRMAQRMQTPYNVSKAAVEMMSKCMALELGPYQIRVNTICPSMTDTEMAANAIATRGRETIAGNHPLRRLGTPDDVAQGALYLAGPRSSWVTGASLAVDGGVACR